MTDNLFDSFAPAIAMADFADLESAVGRAMPGALKKHYLLYNGGAPTRTLVPGNDAWEATDIAMFYSIKNSLPEQGISSEMLAHYAAMSAKKVIPDYLLPFAWDPGGNFYCLSLRDDTIIYFATDLFDAIGLYTSRRQENDAI